MLRNVVTDIAVSALQERSDENVMTEKFERFRRSLCLQLARHCLKGNVMSVFNKGQRLENMRSGGMIS